MTCKDCLFFSKEEHYCYKYKIQIPVLSCRICRNALTGRIRKNKGDDKKCVI